MASLKDGADIRALLSAHFRREPDTEYTARSVDDLNKLVQRRWPFGADEQLAMLLDELARKSPAMGKPSSFSLDLDYPLLWVKGSGEAAFLALALIEAGLVAQPGKGMVALGLLRDGQAANPPLLTLTHRGWREVQERRSKPPLTPQVFVAMQFSPETDRVYDEAIEPAIRAAGYRPYRVDRDRRVDHIDHEIGANIQRSRFMVADFSNQNPGVYFEAGMMQGLGRRVLRLCPRREQQEMRLHFDVNHYQFHFYETEPPGCPTSPADLKAALYSWIVDAEGEGPIPAEERGAAAPGGR